jgi:hypothetical protein
MRFSFLLSLFFILLSLSPSLCQQNVTDDCVAGTLDCPCAASGDCDEPLSCVEVTIGDDGERAERCICVRGTRGCVCTIDATCDEGLTCERGDEVLCVGDAEDVASDTENSLYEPLWLDFALWIWIVAFITLFLMCCVAIYSCNSARARRKLDY